LTRRREAQRERYGERGRWKWSKDEKEIKDTWRYRLLDRWKMTIAVHFKSEYVYNVYQYVKKRDLLLLLFTCAHIVHCATDER
jgi:hypothetical protein